MKITEDVSERSTCRRKVGAIITVDNKIKTTGYNGAPKGLSHCEDMGDNIANGDGEDAVDVSELVCMVCSELSRRQVLVQWL